MAFLNGRPKNAQELQLLNTLLTGAAAAAASSKDASLDKGKSRDEHKAEEESEAPTFSRPGGFKNQPDDPTNPNEARERVRRKLTP